MQNSPSVVCKLDFGKAYDMVDCDFLLYMLDHMWFGSRWRGWIYSCVSSARFSILVNRLPKGYFRSSRGCVKEILYPKCSLS